MKREGLGGDPAYVKILTELDWKATAIRQEISDLPFDALTRREFLNFQGIPDPNVIKSAYVAARHTSKVTKTPISEVFVAMHRLSAPPYWNFDYTCTLKFEIIDSIVGSGILLKLKLNGIYTTFS